MELASVSPEQQEHVLVLEMRWAIAAHQHR